MKLNKRLILNSIAIGGLATVGAIATATVSFAATNPTADNPFISRVAQILGLDTTKVKDAVKQAQTEDVDKMLKNGKITQSEADQMKQDIANGKVKGFGIGRGEIMRGMVGPRMEMSNLATFLGMTESDLRTALDSGQKITDIITSKGKTVADAKAYLIQKQNDQLAQDVTDGKITQSQADNIKSKQSDMIDDFLNGTLPKFHERGRNSTQNNTNTRTGTTTTN